MISFACTRKLNASVLLALIVSLATATYQEGCCRALPYGGGARASEGSVCYAVL